MEKLRSVFDPIKTITDSAADLEVFGLIYRTYKPDVEKKNSSGSILSRRR